MRHTLVPLLSVLVGGWMATPAIAAPLAELTFGDEPINDVVLEAGNVRVVVDSYEPITAGNEPQDNLRYAIYIDGELKTTVSDNVWWFGSLTLQHLDPDGVPEVIAHTFTGGAHCCSIITLYSWQSDRLYRTQTHPLDAAGSGTFDDLDGDGYSEFRSADTRFLYAFGSYASSWPPAVILTFREGTLQDTTSQFPNLLRSDAYTMYEYTRDSTRTEPLPGVNSILAGYVAQKISLGEYESGWNYMLNRYDPDDTWGLTERDRNGNIITVHADFPTALEAFLIDLGYLDATGNPNPELNLKSTVVENQSRF